MWLSEIAVNALLSKKRDEKGMIFKKRVAFLQASLPISGINIKRTAPPIWRVGYPLAQKTKLNMSMSHHSSRFVCSKIQHV